MDVDEILSGAPPVKRPRGAGDGGQGEASEASDAELLAALEEEEEALAPLDEAGLRKLLSAFEKRQLRNQEMRIKFPDQPVKFLDSEVELNTGIQELHALAAEPSLYPLLWGGVDYVGVLLQLMSHENKDIGLAVVALLSELTDAEGAEGGEGEELAKRLLKAGLVALLVALAERLDESAKDEADGVHSALAVAENLLELEPELASARAVKEGLLGFLTKRVRQKGAFDGNKLYASEVLAVLVQQSEEARAQLDMDQLLQALAAYKRQNPGSADERELMENLFNALCAALLHPPNRARFLSGEGVQLMNIMLREKAESRESALKVLDYATTGPEGKACSEKFLEVFGLRTLFPLFLRTPGKARRKTTSVEEHEEHCAALVASLLRNCADKGRQRVLAKFVEQDHIKLDRLVELYLAYLDKVRAVEAAQAAGPTAAGADGEEAAEERYLARLEGGLFTLQLLCLVLADVSVSGPSSIRQRAAKLMAMKGGSFERAKAVLTEYLKNLGPDAAAEKARVQSLLDKL